MTGTDSTFDAAALEARRERISERAGGSLRHYTASGMVWNAAWAIGLQGLAFARGFLVAHFLAPEDYGVWMIIILGYLVIGRLKAVGIGDKYIQQDDPDEETAFQKAFTLEAILTGGMLVILAILTPVLAAMYNAPEIILPGLVLLLSMVGGILQTPIWAYARNLEYKKARRLSAIDPVVGVIATIIAAAAGLSYWSFAIGSLAGATAGGIAAVRHSPFRLRFRYDRGTAKSYFHFSWPLFLTSLSNSVLIQTTTLFAKSYIGFAGIGAMSLGNSVRTYIAFADGIISSTMYPGVCAIKDRLDLLHESFVKSNRLALMWGLPLGVGVSLFAHDLVLYMFGEQWLFAVVLFQSVGLVSAIGHIAFNWDDYLRATGNTRWIAHYAWLGLIGWGIGPLPLMVANGLPGYAHGLFIVGALTLSLRGYYMRKLFPEFAIVPHVLRAIAPTIPAVLAVLAIRAVDPLSRSLAVAIGELLVYLGVTAIATWLTERPLLKEALSYLRKPTPVAA